MQDDYGTLYVDGTAVVTDDVADAMMDTDWRVQVEFDAVANGYVEGWLNSAAISYDAEQQEVTVGISCGDPRGALTMTLRRTPDGATYLHVPHEEDSLPHVPLTLDHPGTYRVGS